MSFPEGYLWDFPGFFSVAVSYHRTPDFFFSGHVGFSIICTCENFWLGKPRLAILSLTTAFISFFVMLVTRGHYTVDLLTGLMVGHYCWFLSKPLSKSLDRKLASLRQNTKDEYIKLA